MDRKVVGAYILGEVFSQTSLGRIVKALPLEGDAVIRLLQFIEPAIASTPEAAQLVERHSGAWSKGSDLHTLALLDFHKDGDAPYLVTEYLQGRLLSDVIRRAAAEGIPFALDQAVYLAERIAGALVSLTQQRVVCGGLTPERVLVTFEGEIKILPCVFRDLQTTPLSAEPSMESTWRYLPPDQAAGKVSNPATDIYSVGALFFEFLCGQPFRPSTGDFDPAARLDEAAAGLEGREPPPDNLLAILKKSLLPDAAGAYTGLAALKGDLDQLIASGDYSPTTFNVAFLMHSLFRGEDEAEGEDDKAFAAMDRTAFRPKPEPAQAPPPPPVEPEVPQETAAAKEPAPAPPPPSGPVVEDEETRGSRKGLFIGIAAAVIVVIAGVAIWLAMPSAPKGPSPDELKAQAQLRKIAQERAQFEASQKAMAARLKALEDQKKDLEDQVSRAKTNAEKRRAQKALEDARKKLEAQQEEQKKMEKAPPAAPPPTTSESAPEKKPENTPKTSQQSPPEGGAAPAPASENAPAPGTKTAAGGPANTPAVSPANAPAAPAAAGKPAVKPGDEVPLWSVDARPKPLNKFHLNATDLARRNQLHGTIYVEVFIDEAGHVTKAKVVKGLEPDYGMNDAVRRAALKMKYTPALKDGVPVKTTLTFPVVIR